MNELEKYIENLGTEFDQDFSDVYNAKTSSQKLMYLYAYYHYFNADSSKIDDIINGDVYSWNSPDHVCGIYIDEDSDNRDIDALLVVYTEDNSFDISSSLKSLKDAESAIINAKERKTGHRPELSRLLGEEDYKIGSSKPLKVKVITNYIPKSVSQKKSVINALNALKPENPFTSYHVVFGTDIEYEILEIENPKEYVDGGIIEIDEQGNYAKFGDENSIIVNISALSLKSLYEKYSYRGLFSQNLRYYVKNSTVDSNIVESIQDKSENFWYYNNGIIIICNDYMITDKLIALKQFSIINGGQTTKLIGETDFSKDFFLQCKIIKNKYENEDDKIEFIANVAEASNTQKPIKSKDLIANRPEQRMLKKQLSNVGIYCQIKRGEKVNKKLYPAAYQNTTNEELGQFILSFMYQRPGAARGNKQSICGNMERYSLIFDKVYDSNLLADLLKIKAYYKQWMTKVKKQNDDSDPYRVGLINNGMFFTVAVIGTLSKIYYHNEYLPALVSSVMSEQQMEVISQYDLCHRFLRDDIDYKDSLYSLFEYCYVNFLRPGYEFFRSFKNVNQFSNFTKIDNNYSTYILKQILFYFQSGMTKDRKKELEQFFYKANEEELESDADLLNRYVNLVYVDINAESSLDEDVIERIKNALVDYRTKTYKKNRIKAYQVFKNIAADRIAKFAPTSLEDLESLRCFDKSQIELYGNDVIEIVKNVLANS